MIDWLYGLQHFGIKLGLDNIRALLGELDHPERSVPSVLVAGTNGKGSVAAMLHALLGAAGFRAGLFTSPHLVRPTERIRVGAEEISAAALDALLARIKTTIDVALARGTLEAHPSFFEVVTAAALEAFHAATLDVAVLEVGLGGRLDATNAVEAELSVIVSVDFDHVRTLGPGIAAIAAEKAGIVKAGRPLVSGVVRQRAVEVIARVCRERGARWIDARIEVELTGTSDGTVDLRSRRRSYEGIELALAGRHQLDNARIAIAAFEQLAPLLGFEPEPACVRHALRTVRWPGRLQWLRRAGDGPDLLLDGAHNPAGVRALVAYLRDLARPAPVAVFGAMRDKQLGPMLDALAPHVHAIVLTRPDVERALEPEDLAHEIGRRCAQVELIRQPSLALARADALAGAERFVLVTGSLYLVGEVLAGLEGEPSPGPVSM
jgi:dihydrofolate synthase/folylpolyglutamate synthase